MMQNTCCIDKKININDTVEILRNKMHNIVIDMDNLQDINIIRASQDLDVAINQCMREAN